MDAWKLQMLGKAQAAVLHMTHESNVPHCAIKGRPGGALVWQLWQCLLPSANRRAYGKLGASF